MDLKDYLDKKRRKIHEDMISKNENGSILDCGNILLQIMLKYKNKKFKILKDKFSYNSENKYNYKSIQKYYKNKKLKSKNLDKEIISRHKLYVEKNVKLCRSITGKGIKNLYL